jgi:hypothetical protein
MRHLAVLSAAAGLLAVLASPLALAQSLDVAANSLMRLPGNSSSVELQQLTVADYGTLLIPENLSQLNVQQLRLGHEARITIVPSQRDLQVTVQQAVLESGSQFVSRGAPGTYTKAALPARNLNLQIVALQADQLSVDARGGNGAPGYVGLDGAGGEAPGCTWGEAGRGSNGSNGGDGRDGAAGALVRLQLPLSFPAERVTVRVEGGNGGAPGVAGKPGAGGAPKGCLVYRAAGGKPGRPGLPGQPGQPGPAGQWLLKRS